MEGLNLYHLNYIWNRLIDWCLMPTLAAFQLYRGMNIFYILNREREKLKEIICTVYCIFITEKDSIFSLSGINTNTILVL